MDKAKLRARLLRYLEEQGFFSKEPFEDKDQIRKLHRAAVLYQRERARKRLARDEPKLLAYIAHGRELDVKKIRPVLIPVARKSKEERLFRYARLHWSIPISSGYGRRLRFLVWDDYHGKLMGLIGLSDPVYSLAPRDRWIGWNKEVKKRRIKNVMDAFVLGAVPPYSLVLGGKLVALGVWSREVSRAFSERYAQRRSTIRGEPVGELALITTTSALGRSSLYNRLKFHGKKIFQPVGFTQGTGDLPFLNGFYDELFRLVREYEKPTAKHPSWGKGYRNRREVITKALKLLQLPLDLRRHGVKREVFVVPLGPLARDYLQGKTEEFRPENASFEELAAYALERWVWPRAKHDERYRAFEPEQWRLWSG